MAETVNAVSLKRVAFCDLEREIAVTRRVLERVPEQHWDWKPHEKSMDLGGLATHVTTLVEWFHGTLVTDQIDFNDPPELPSKFSGKEPMLRAFEKYAEGIRSGFDSLSDEELLVDWTIRQGEQIFATRPRYVALRVWCLNHLVNHRAQLCVYLRMLDVAVPANYFESADEPEMVWD